MSITRIEYPARAAGRKVVIVVGAGFAGLNAAKRLANEPGVNVVLVDQRNHHLFQPLLYQVATAGLNPADIAVPIRAQFRDAPNVEVQLGRVEAVDLSARVVRGAEYSMEYDYLILACGARHSYFGKGEWEEAAPGLKTLEQATEIRRRILSAFERAESGLEPSEQDALMTFVVVGAGPTGVELAGAIADISRTVLRGDFRRIRPETARVVLIEAGPRVLPSFSPQSSEHARRDLEQLGVEVRTGCRVEDVDAEGVTIGRIPAPPAGGTAGDTTAPAAPERLAARSVFWAAGVKAAPLEIEPRVAHDRAGRIEVDPDLSIAGHPEVFVAGDMASVEIAPGKPLPGVAPAAIQAARHAAEAILGDLAGQPRAPFVYRDKGQMATIGRSRAVAELAGMKLTGRLAWLVWLFVHVLSLIGFRNRAAVLFQWTWNYVLQKRESRLITERDWRFESTEKP